MTHYEIKDITMIYLQRWQRPLTNLGLRIAVIGAILFGMQYVYMAYLRQAHSAEPASPNAILADNLSSMSTDNQVTTLQTRLRRNPDDEQAYVLLSAAYLQKVREVGDPTYYGKAEQALGRALKLKPDDFTAMVQMGALSLARHQFHEALDWGEKARLISPGSTLIYGVIGDAQIELGDYDAALETFQTMVDLRPNLSSYSRASYMRELHGDVPGAIDAMQRAIQAGGPNTENTNWTRVQLGNLYFNSGNLEAAEAQYNQALTSYPGYVYAIAGLGRVRAAQGQIDQAIELMNQAVAIIPMPEFVITLGDLYQVTGQMKAADQEYKLVATIEKLYQANGVDLDLEIAMFNADHDQNLDETLTVARKAFAKRPSIYGADVLAWVLYKTGNFTEAQKYSAEACKLGTKDALKLFHAGMIAHALHDEQQASQYLEQALAINPHFSILYADQAQKTLLSIRQTTGP
jgi:tetratricopeptide (TPR) repeat protein